MFIFISHDTDSDTVLMFYLQTNGMFYQQNDTNMRSVLTVCFIYKTIPTCDLFYLQYDVNVIHVIFTKR